MSVQQAAKRFTAAGDGKAVGRVLVWVWCCSGLGPKLVFESSLR